MHPPINSTPRYSIPRAKQRAAGSPQPRHTCAQNVHLYKSRRPPRSLRKENITNYAKRTRGPRLIVGANWRLDNANSPAAMLQKNSPDATWMTTPYVPGILLLLTCHVPVCLESLCLQSFRLSRITNRPRQWVCWMSMGAKRSLMKNTQQRGTCAWKSQQRDACFRSRQSHFKIFHTKNSKLSEGGVRSQG